MSLVFLVGRGNYMSCPYKDKATLTLGELCIKRKGTGAFVNCDKLSLVLGPIYGVVFHILSFSRNMDVMVHEIRLL